jgi:hypothetical protein
VYRKVPRLIESILSPISTIPPVTTTLSISMALGRGEDEGDWLQNPSIADAVTRLTSLTQLCTYEFDFSTPRGAELLEALSGSSISSASMWKTRFKSPLHQACFIDSLPRLEAVELLGSTFAHGTPGDRIPSSIRSLTLGSHDLPFLTATQTPPYLPNLTQFHLSSAVGPWMHRLSDVLEAMGPTLRYLNIGFFLCSPSSIPVDPIPLSLSSNIGLRELTFEGICFRADPRHQPRLTKLLIDALSGLSSLALKTVELAFTPGSSESIPPSFLEQLDQLLSETKFASLEHVFLRFGRGYTHDDSIAFLRRHCSTLDRTGILRILDGNTVVSGQAQETV